MPTKKVSLKLTSAIGTAQPVFMPRVLPEEKIAKEEFIVREFAKSQNVGGHTLTDIKPNPDDSDGKSDVLAKHKGIEIGIQLTELKISHRPQSADIARGIVNKLLEEILSKVKPPYPVFVDIHSSQDYQNASIKLRGKSTTALAELIIESITNEQYSPAISDYFDQPGTALQPKLLSIPDSLKHVITRIEVSKIPEKHTTMCQGKDNLYINFNFDIVVSSNETFEYLIEEIFRKKSFSKSSILLVWSCDQDFWGEEEKVAKMLKDRAGKSSFEFVYYFSFINAQKLFETNKKVMVIKEKP